MPSDAAFALIAVLLSWPNVAVSAAGAALYLLVTLKEPRHAD